MVSFNTVLGDSLLDQIKKKKSETSTYYLPKNALLNLSAQEAFLKMDEHHASFVLLLYGLKPYLQPKHNKFILEAFALIEFCTMLGSGGVCSYFNSVKSVPAVLPALKVLLPEEYFKHFQFAVAVAKRDPYSPVSEFRENPLIKACKGKRLYNDLESDCFEDLECFVGKNFSVVCGQYFLDNRIKYEES